MSVQAKREYLQAMVMRYRQATRREKQRLLRRRHVTSRIHIGVRKGETAMEAHAWLSWQGRVLNDSADVSKRYAELQNEQWGRINRFID